MRKVIQIVSSSAATVEGNTDEIGSVIQNHLFALCDDGTIWALSSLMWFHADLDKRAEWAQISTADIEQGNIDPRPIGGFSE